MFNVGKGTSGFSWHLSSMPGRRRPFELQKNPFTFPTLLLKIASIITFAVLLLYVSIAGTIGHVPFIACLRSRRPQHQAASYAYIFALVP